MRAAAMRSSLPCAPPREHAGAHRRASADRARLPAPGASGVLLAALLAAALWALAGPGHASAQNGVDAERALRSYAAMQQQYYMPYHHLYRGEETENAQEYAYMWPFSQALAATTAIAGMPAVGAPYLPAVREHLAGLRFYWNRRARPPGQEGAVLAAGGAEKFLHDNEWVGLQLVRAYRMLGDPTLLLKAVE